MHDDLDAYLNRKHQVITTEELHDLGYDRHAIGKFVATGRLKKQQRGWYRLPTTPLTMFGRARIAGGAVTCLSALQHLGFWTPEFSELHLRVGAYGLGDTWHHLPSLSLPDDALDSHEGILLCAQDCCELDELVAILDEMARRELDVTSLDGHPLAKEKLQRAIALSGHRADSALESLVRVRLDQLGIKHRRHVKVGVFELDFLIGDYLAVECDGFAYHSNQADVIRDRKKDRYFESLGYSMLRFTYWDIIERWDECESQILAMVRAERHRYPSSRRVAPFAV